jgi:hypothetical protein
MWSGLMKVTVICSGVKRSSSPDINLIFCKEVIRSSRSIRSSCFCTGAYKTYVINVKVDDSVV